MKRWSGLSGLLCVALGLSRIAPAQTAPAPKLALSQESWSFGAVWHPESPALLLIVKNEGTADLKLGRVTSSCGCTLAAPQRSVIPPGQSTEISIRFDTQGKQGDVSSKVTIPSNDPARPEVVFNVLGHVKRAVTRTPLGGLVIRALETKPGLSGSVRLENQMEQPLRLKLLSKNIAALDIEIKEIAAGKVYDVVARTTREMPPGITRGTLVFSTGLSQEEKLSIAMRVQVLSCVEPVPPAIWLDPESATAASQRLVSLQYYGTQQPFQVTSVDSRSPNVKVTFKPSQPPSGGLERLQPPITALVPVEIALPPAAGIPAEGVVIVFTTNDPACPKAEVLVTTQRAAWELRMYGPPEELLTSLP